jgi:hypothetical protein
MYVGVVYPNPESTMRKSEFYTLTVALWPHAVEAGVTPVQSDSFESGPQFYREHEFFFLHPPTRQDWWELCRQTPWMACFQDHHRRHIDGNPWPLVGPGRKACDVDLLDAQGRKIGRIDVRRQDCHVNGYPSIPFIGVDNWDAMVRGLKGEVKRAAREWVMFHDNVIQEAVMDANEPPTDALIVRVGKRLLRERGFIKGKEKKTEPAISAGLVESCS